MISKALPSCSKMLLGGMLVVSTMAILHGESFVPLDKLPPLILDVTGEWKIVRADMVDSVLCVAMQLPTGKGGGFIELKVEPDEAAARQYYLRKLATVPSRPFGPVAVGDESETWKSEATGSLKSGGTTIFRRGTVVVSISGVLGWDRMQEAAAALDRKIQSISPKTLGEQLVALQASPAARER